MNKYILIALILISSLVSATNKNNHFNLITSENRTLEVDKIKNGLKFKNFNNKLVVIVFFGHNCPPCIHEMPILNKLSMDLQDDLKIIGLEVQGMSKKELTTYKNLKKINYDVVSGLESLNFIKYIEQEVKWNGSIPFTIFFNRKGEAKYAKAGTITYKQFKIILKKIDK